MDEQLHDFSYSFENAISVAQQRHVETVRELHRLREELRARDEVIQRLRVSLGDKFDEELECRLVKDQLKKFEEGMQQVVAEDKRRPHEDQTSIVKINSDGKRPAKVLKQPSGRASKRRCVRQAEETWLEIMRSLNAFDLDMAQCVSKLFRKIVDGQRASLALAPQCWFVEVKKFHAYSALQGATRDGYVWQRRNVDIVSASLDVAAEAFVAALKFSVVYSRLCFGFGHMLVQDVFYFMGKVQRTCRLHGTASAPPTTMFNWCSFGFNTNRALADVPENKLSPTIFVEPLLDSFETAPSFAVELFPRFFYYRYLNDVDLCAWATKGLRKFRLLAHRIMAIEDEGIIGFCFNEGIKAVEDVELELHYPNVGDDFFDSLVQACQGHPVDFNLDLRLYIDDNNVNYVSFDNHFDRREQRGSFAFYDYRDQTVPFEVARSLQNSSMRLIRGSEIIKARKMDAENPL
ncbi:hypothetical protein AAVH_27952 [Aphelenchoides avenae]|nr:hypothetical protein AAVH_27952 [Aphelenchus avenae]